MNPALAKEIGQRMKAHREAAGLSSTGMDEVLGLGPGWTNCFETAYFTPTLDVVLATMGALKVNPAAFFDGLLRPDGAVHRLLDAVEDNADLVVSWPYGDHDAKYRLENATLVQWQDVLGVLRDGFAANDMTGAVVRSFQRAVHHWPHANASDLWYYVIAQAYLDPFNHPAADARRDWGQSWKRTGGWALERVLVEHYAPTLQGEGIQMAILNKADRIRILKSAGLIPGVIPDKADVMLYGLYRGKLEFLGVVHVKASFAERRTDDIPMSQTLMGKGFLSPLWTLDGKSHPSPEPVNAGELGPVWTPGQPDLRSDKRKDIEVEGHFSGCYSYNRRTLPTPAATPAVARVYTCDFSNPSDTFVASIVEAWRAKCP